MSPRPRLASSEIGRLRDLVGQPSGPQLEERSPLSVASSVEATLQSHVALPAALAVLLESGPRSDHASPLLVAGTTVGRYEVVRVLGAGGMGVVYEAIDPLLQRRVALKLLKHRRHDDSERALGEARALAQITHPGVVTAFDVGQAEDVTYVAMELIDGASLRRQLGIWPRPWKQLKTTFLQVGRALEAAHQAGLVHCDVKPDNVLVDGQGRAHVADFGLARYFVPARSWTEPAEEIRGRGRWLGTPGYVAPELLEGREPSPQTDQFGYCVMLVEALVGLGPEMEEGSPVPIRERLVSHLERAAAPRHVKRALERGLEPTPERRFPDMGTLLQALMNPRQRRALAFGAGLTLVAAAGGWFSLVSTSNSTESRLPSPGTPSSAAISTPTPTQTPSLPRLPPRGSNATPLRHSAPLPPFAGVPRWRPAPSTRPVAPPPVPEGPQGSPGAATPPRRPTLDTEPAAPPTNAPQRPFGPRK